MTSSAVKEKLRRGEPVWGASAPVADPFANQLVISTGVDFLWIDTEHSSFGVESLGLLPVLARRHECMPMVRVTGLDANLIKKALDAGAMAVMVPQITTAAEAAQAVRPARYPPLGARGASPLWTLHENVSWDDYLPRANDELCMVLQTESPEGIDNLEAIAAVDGVHVLFAGPSDLAASFGVIGQMSHPRLKQFLAHFPQRVRQAGKAAGISVGSCEAAREAFHQGYRFISFGNLLFRGAIGLKTDLDHLCALNP